MLQLSDFPLQIIVQRKHVGIRRGTQWARNGECFVGVEAFSLQYRMRVAFHVQSSPTAVRMYIQLQTADTQLIPL